MDNPGEILRLCRLCLVKDQVNIPIFAEQGDSREIFLKISSCLPVKVSIEDRLPKKICDGCSEKLNSFYEFWSSSANAEKTLLSWLGEDEVEEKKVQAVPKSLTASATLVKEESAELVDEAHAESIEESTKDESEAPPTKRARRSAAVKAQINLAPDSEDDDLDTTEPLTKMEEESADSDGEEKDPSYTEMPGTSADDEQAGPSGMGKDGVEAPTEGCEEIVIEIVEDALEEGGKKTRPCNACGKPFKDLGRHLETHGYDNCLECLLHFPDKKSLDDHLMFTHQVAPEWHYCGVCDVSFSSVAILAIHNAKHTGRFECPLCEFVVKGRYRHSLINHIRRHEGKFEVRCEVCGQGFFSRTSLTSHLEMHAGIPKYECEYCKKRFTVKRYLEVHKSSNHKKELYGVDESFQCYICGRRFSFEKSLIRHLSAIHKVGEDRTVNCPVCNKTIANNHNLKKHMRTHTGEKRFCCDLCGKVFSEKKYLHKHQEIHEREKEHKLKRQELITKSESFEEEYLIEFDDGDYHLC